MSLPSENLTHILQYLSPKDLIHFEQINRFAKNLIRNYPWNHLVQLQDINHLKYVILNYRFRKFGIDRLILLIEKLSFHDRTQIINASHHVIIRCTILNYSKHSLGDKRFLTSSETIYLLGNCSVEENVNTLLNRLQFHRNHRQISSRNRNF